jgi:hypothetical protein
VMIGAACGLLVADSARLGGLHVAGLQLLRRVWRLCGSSLV